MGAELNFEDMSMEQQDVMSLCRQQIQDHNCTVKRTIVQGKAGTGKSAVIKAMCKMFKNEGIGYQVLAPTGNAAVNIDGSTIHSFLKLPVSGDLVASQGTNLRNFQLQMNSIRFIIIDEYSMIGMRLMRKIHMRLCGSRGSVSEPFGGYFIYLFGDLRQLPPVRDTAIYMEPTDEFSQFSARLITLIQRRIVLSVCYRQNESEHAFKDVLDKLTVGEITREGWELLMTRRETIALVSANSIHLFPTNAKVDDHNMIHLENKARVNELPIALIHGLHKKLIHVKVQIHVLKDYRVGCICVKAVG